MLAELAAVTGVAIAACTYTRREPMLAMICRTLSVSLQSCAMQANEPHLQAGICHGASSMP